MSTMPSLGKVAVCSQPNLSFEIREFPLRRIRTGEILVRVRMSTICRSDIHSYQGHRPNPWPAVFGHEIIGSIIEIGDRVIRDLRGIELTLGDRITWSEYLTPTPDYYSEVLDLPQKSLGVEKYG